MLDEDDKPGVLNCLSVGGGHIKVSFDPTNPEERIRAARMVKEMLSRGYALLVAVGGEGPNTQYQRATGFDEEHCEYIIADLDLTAAEPEAATVSAAPLSQAPAASGPPKTRMRTPGKERRIPAENAHTVAVARIAGG
jgi:hypothetical protein